MLAQHQLLRFMTTLSIGSILAISPVALVHAARSPQPVTTKPLSQSCSAHTQLRQPIVLVIQDGKQNPTLLQKNYRPKFTYGSLEQFQGNADIVMLVPEGSNLSDEDLAAIEGKGWGRSFFMYLIIPGIVRDVVQQFMAQNTAPIFSTGFSTVQNMQVRAIARDVCLDWTWGFGEAFGICDFFSGFVDQLVNRVQNYFRE